jgi:hypothetical protein
VADLSNAHDGNVLDHEVEPHLVLQLDVSEALLDLREATTARFDQSSELGSFQREHPRELGGTQAVIEHWAQLLERKTQVL